MTASCNSGFNSTSTSRKRFTSKRSLPPHSKTQDNSSEDTMAGGSSAVSGQERVVSKIYVLDTNVLLHDPLALHSFNEHKIVIPMTVLEELDTIKDRKQKDVSREARMAIRAIDDLLADATPKQIQQGVEIPAHLMHEESPPGLLAVYPDQLDEKVNKNVYTSGSPQQANDDRIINVALVLQDEHPEAFVCLVTKDINMRLKAKGMGLANVEDYRKDKVLDDIDLLARGYEEVEGSFWQQVDKVETRTEGRDVIHTIDRSVMPDDVYPNMYILDEDGFVGYIKAIDEDYLYIVDKSETELMHGSVWGLRPRNMEQAMAVDLLQKDDIDITILTGPAGSGKTLLALAAGIHAILEEGRYDKLIVARSTPPIAEDIGFLPGSEEEKMAPWLAAFDDNLEVLHGNDESSCSSMEYVKQKANIQFKSLNFMRGRSFNNSWIIIDEAQGLTQFQLKSIITRVGENSKIVILGNLAQIDNNYINPLTSGLTYLVEKMKDFEHAGIMHVNGIERSRLAAFAEENL